MKFNSSKRYSKYRESAALHHIFAISLMISTIKAALIQVPLQRIKLNQV